MAVHPLGDMIATAQGPGMAEKSQAHIRIWRVDNLVTLSVVGLNRFDAGIITTAFSPEGNVLLAIEDHILSLWEWSQDTEIGRASVDQTDIHGSTFLTIDKEIAITYGKRHLTLWRRAKDDVLERQDLITLVSGFSSKIIMSLEVLPNGTFLTGDSDGYLALWMQDESTETYFISKEIRAHANNVNTILLLPGELLVTGSSARKEGEISIWNLNDKLSKYMTARLPPETGEVKSLCPSALETYQGTFYLGTSQNIILEGSLQGTFTTIIHGHQEEIRALAVDPYDTEYVTAGIDNIICKWDKDSLLWKVLNVSNCFSLAIHPESTVVAVGEATGNVVVLNLENGDQITRFSVSKSSLNTMAFSP
ncbi:echinoderm microtubule-associated protein-like CG42247, partial [Centruroides sculpturatus]